MYALVFIWITLSGPFFFIYDALRIYSCSLIFAHNKLLGNMFIFLTQSFGCCCSFFTSSGLRQSWRDFKYVLSYVMKEGGKVNILYYYYYYYNKSLYMFFVTTIIFSIVLLDPLSYND